MASCQTWATSSHFRHPWLETKSMKRKRPEVFIPEEDSAEFTTSTVVLPPKHASKRRRCTTLENGFAHLTLVTNTSSYHNPATSTNDIRVQEVPSPQSTMDAEMTIEPTPQHPSSYLVEEPCTPDVNMKKSSWYELGPDRIVITDLDSFTEEDEEEERPITVNTSLLEKIRSQVMEAPKVPSTPAGSNDRALILFRPPPRFGDLSEEAKEEVRPEETAPNVPEVDDDAMDVEP